MELFPDLGYNFTSRNTGALPPQGAVAVVFCLLSSDTLHLLKRSCVYLL